MARRRRSPMLAIGVTAIVAIVTTVIAVGRRDGDSEDKGTVYDGSTRDKKTISLFRNLQTRKLRDREN